MAGPRLSQNLVAKSRGYGGRSERVSVLNSRGAALQRGSRERCLAPGDGPRRRAEPRVMRIWPAPPILRCAYQPQAPSKPRSMTRSVSRRCHNSLPRLSRALECIVLAMHISAHREGRAGVPEPFCGHDDWQVLHVHERPAGASWSSSSMYIVEVVKSLGHRQFSLPHQLSGDRGAEFPARFQLDFAWLTHHHHVLGGFHPTQPGRDGVDAP